MIRYQEHPINENGEGLRIGIAVARFNQDVCDGLLSGAINELHRLGVKGEHITVCSAPGALEIPLVLQTMTEQEETTYDALIALGAVIRGETYHFEVVSNDSCRAVMEVQLNSGVPIANGILTTEDDDQALVRMHGKGADCARCAVEMAQLHARLRADLPPQPVGA